MSRTPRILVPLAFALLPAVGLAEPAVIGLARAYLGPDSTLDSIRTIRFVGTLERQDPDHPGSPPIRAGLEMVFQKPYEQRQELHMEKTSYVTVLDGYDAWDRIADNADPSRFRLEWQSAGVIRTLRANTWENLNFYRGGDGVLVEDKGPATIDGVVCERVDFTHDPGNVFERYFDRDSGRLVVTIRGPETIRESGEIRAGGIRFPQSIVSETKLAGGKTLLSTVHFDRVTINEPVVPDAFSAPSILPTAAAPKPSPAPAK